MHFGLVCNLQADINIEETFLIPSLLPNLSAVTKSNQEEPKVWTKTTNDEVLQVSFVSVNYKCNRESMNISQEKNWPTSRKFLPDTLFFRLVAMLVHEAKNVSDAFENLYLDRLVIKLSDMCYLLRHYAEDQVLRLTVYDGPGYEHVPAADIRKLEKCLDELKDGFSMMYRFEVHCDDCSGEPPSWFPLENLQQGSHNASSIWYRSDNTIENAEMEAKAKAETEAKVDAEANAKVEAGMKTKVEAEAMKGKCAFKTFAPFITCRILSDVGLCTLRNITLFPRGLKSPVQIVLIPIICPV